MASVYELLSQYSSAKQIASVHLTKLTNLLSTASKGRYGKEKAEEIRQTIGNGIILHTDEGIIWFRIPQYSTFSQVIPSGSDDDLVKRILLTVEIEFLTV